MSHQRDFQKTVGPMASVWVHRETGLTYVLRRTFTLHKLENKQTGDIAEFFSLPGWAAHGKATSIISAWERDADLG